MPKHRFFVSPEQLMDGVVQVVGENARQIRVVLRLQPGDEIGVLDGTGREYHCVIETVHKDGVVARVSDWVQLDVEPRLHLTLVQALAKGEKVEWVIQHGTEIGVSRFVLVQTERSIVRLSGERERSRIERWKRIAKEAAEQSHRARVPEVEGVYSLADGLARIAHTSILTLHPGAPSLSEWCQHQAWPSDLSVIVGPEGGLTDEEVERCASYGATTVSLMPRILRTETAALVAVSQLLFCESLQSGRASAHALGETVSEAEHE